MARARKVRMPTWDRHAEAMSAGHGRDAGVLRLEGCDDKHAGWAVALLCNKDVDLAATGRAWVVEVIAVQEQDQVGIVYLSAGEVSQRRLRIVPPGVGRPGPGQCHDRRIELAGETL